MGFIEHDKSKPQFSREEYTAARTGKSLNLFKVQKVKLLAVSFVDCYEGTDGLIQDGNRWTELFTFNGSYVGRLSKSLSCGTIREMYDTQEDSNESLNLTSLEKLLRDYK